VSARTARILRLLLWTSAVATAALLAFVLFSGPPNGPRQVEARLRRQAGEVSAALASPDPETRMGCLWALCCSDLVTGDSIYAHLGPADRARARQVVLEALEANSDGQPWLAARAISDNIRTEMHSQADKVGACLGGDVDPRARLAIASALASTGNADAMRRHLSRALLGEPERRNRLWYARLLWRHDLGPVEARLLTRRAGGKPPATESAALAELKKELATGSQDAADALCFSGHLDLLSAEQKAGLAGRPGPDGRARVLARQCKGARAQRGAPVACAREGQGPSPECSAGDRS